MTSESPTFRLSRRVRFQEADPAGISFFSNVYGMHHEAYENWVVDGLKIGYSEWFLNPGLGIPLIKSEADYFAPLIPGKTYDVIIRLEKLGKSSFVLCSDISDGPAKYATVRTVHVFWDSKAGTKVEIPTGVRAAMAAWA